MTTTGGSVTLEHGRLNELGGERQAAAAAASAKAPKATDAGAAAEREGRVEPKGRAGEPAAATVAGRRRAGWSPSAEPEG